MWGKRRPERCARCVNVCGGCGRGCGCKVWGGGENEKREARVERSELRPARSCSLINCFLLRIEFTAILLPSRPCLITSCVFGGGSTSCYKSNAPANVLARTFSFPFCRLFFFLPFPFSLISIKQNSRASESSTGLISTKPATHYRIGPLESVALSVLRRRFVLYTPY